MAYKIKLLEPLTLLRATAQITSLVGQGHWRRDGILFWGYHAIFHRGEDMKWGCEMLKPLLDIRNSTSIGKLGIYFRENPGHVRIRAQGVTLILPRAYLFQFVYGWDINWVTSE